MCIKGHIRGEFIYAQLNDELLLNYRSQQYYKISQKWRCWWTKCTTTWKMKPSHTKLRRPLNACTTPQLYYRSGPDHFSNFAKVKENNNHDNNIKMKPLHTNFDKVLCKGHQTTKFMQAASQRQRHSSTDYKKKYFTKKILAETTAIIWVSSLIKSWQIAV